GDGRCSCDPENPTACGCPPPPTTPMWESAHIGYLTVARIGDTDGTCTPGTGCVNGTYYLNLNVANAPPGAPDPVGTLQTLFNNFRANRAGHPDAILSAASTPVDSLPADGVSSTILTIALADIDGNPLTTGGASITVSHDLSSEASCAI